MDWCWKCRAASRCSAVRTAVPRFSRRVSRRGRRPVLTLAPTPLAALAGGRSGVSFKVLDQQHLVSAVSPLPLIALRWPPQVLQRLSKLGVYRVGQALRLPRAGFARRFGREPLQMLDQLVARSVDLRTPFRVPERFRAQAPVCP